jgi:hypothetical protein
MYVDDSNKGQGTHFKYTNEQIRSHIEHATVTRSKAVRLLERTGEDTLRMQATVGDMLVAIPKDLWLHLAVLLLQDAVQNKDVVVFGSMEPWVEALALAHNAAHVVTVEYNNLTYGDALTGDIPITTVAKQEFNAFFASNEGRFSAAFSVSSFDHDGLGRYGDPLEVRQHICSLGHTQLD